MRTAIRVAARFLRAWGRHYDLTPGTPIKEVIDRWVTNDDKANDDSMPQWYPLSEVWPYREYNWTRENSRSGFARVEGKQVDLPGPLKWDALALDLKKNGWDPGEPLHLAIGKNGKAKVGEGNHRLAIAREVRLTKIPVRCHFNVSVELTPGHGSMYRETPSPAAVQQVIREVAKNPATQKDLSPEEQEQVEKIMRLLF